MPNRSAKARAVAGVREPTATGSPSGTSRRSLTNCSAIQPVDRIPQRMASGTTRNVQRRLGCKDAYLIDAVRTPFGKHRGGLSGVRTDDLAALPIGELVRRNPALDPTAVEDVILGDTNGAGEDNRNVARMAGLLAGLPPSVPGVTVNRLCGSGGEAIVQAARAIRAGDAETLIAGGVESMSRAPFVLPKPETAFPTDARLYHTQVGWR